MSTTTFTQFLRHPNDVIDQLGEGDVILRRRGEEDLRLSVASQVTAMSDGLAALGRLLVDALSDQTVLERIAARTPLPWLRFLPEHEREVFFRELFECVEASGEVGTFAPVARLLDEWQATAAVYADPRLAASLRRSHPGDGSIVQRPALG